MLPSKPSQSRKLPGQSVACVTQLVPWHVMPGPHDVAAAHCPQESHVSISPPEQRVAFGVHVGEPEQLHGPHEQLEVHCSVPYWFDPHACFVVGAQAPCPVHEPCTQPPSAPQVSVSVPQLPHDTGFVCPGAHAPTHAPSTQVWLPHGVTGPHVFSTHDCTPLPEHCFWPAEHAPVQAVAEHFSLLGHGESVHCPFVSQV